MGFAVGAVQLQKSTGQSGCIVGGHPKICQMWGIIAEDWIGGHFAHITYQSGIIAGDQFGHIKAKHICKCYYN